MKATVLVLAFLLIAFAACIFLEYYLAAVLFFSFILLCYILLAVLSDFEATVERLIEGIKK
jgi:hypothetical protein